MADQLSSDGIEVAASAPVGAAASGALARRWRSILGDGRAAAMCAAAQERKFYLPAEL